jgi:leucyl/phenylalanyl-tRNA--protein transferase
MVLRTAHFKVSRSLRKALQHFANNPACELRFDHVFAAVIQACAHTSRAGQAGTWIVPEMVQAYIQLHQAGRAHSVETWIDGQLAGGLYFVNLGSMVFGESMFAHQADASKIALAALVAFCRAHGISMIDCQQNTPHLASLGAAEISRTDFAHHLAHNVDKISPSWQFNPVHWNQIFTAETPTPP